MSEAGLLVVVPFLFLGAALYTSVGHGGATVYLAILALAGYAVRDFLVIVLVLNVVAAGIAFVWFRQAGHLDWRLLAPFALAGVPFAYLGASLRFGSDIETWLLGGALLVAGLRLLFLAQPVATRRLAGWPVWAAALAIGAALGFLAGAVGIGGGIFLSPLLMFVGWADVKQAGAVASGYIVLNSLAGLAARLPHTAVDWPTLALLVGFVAAGAAVGSFLGAKRLPRRRLEVVLGVVLLIAATRTFLA